MLLCHCCILHKLNYSMEQKCIFTAYFASWLACSNSAKQLLKVTTPFVELSVQCLGCRCTRQFCRSAALAKNAYPISAKPLKRAIRIARVGLCAIWTSVIESSPRAAGIPYQPFSMSSPAGNTAFSTGAWQPWDISKISNISSLACLCS